MLDSALEADRPATCSATPNISWSIYRLLNRAGWCCVPGFSRNRRPLCGCNKSSLLTMGHRWQPCIFTIRFRSTTHSIHAPLTRDQLWGLVVRAERPEVFLVGMDECRILGRTHYSLDRQLRFRQLLIHDRVTFNPPQQVRYRWNRTYRSRARAW